MGYKPRDALSHLPPHTLRSALPVQPAVPAAAPGPSISGSQGTDGRGGRPCRRLCSHTQARLFLHKQKRKPAARGGHIYFLLAVGDTVTVRWPPQPSGRTGPILCPCLLGCGSACPSCRDCGLWTFPGQKQRGLFYTQGLAHSPVASATR